MIRQRTEALALAPFKDVASSLGYEYASGQGRSNRLALDGNYYFQFGDLRVELPDHTVVVEVESAGGVTNLAKYWECIESGRITRPLKLLHVFLQKSANDYEAHILAWRFLDSKMKASLGARWDSHCATARDTSPESLAAAVLKFRQWLTTSAA